MSAIGRISIMVIFVMTNASCARTPWYSAGAPAVPYSQPTAVRPTVSSVSLPQMASDKTSLDYNQLLRFEYDCNRRNEQLNLLEDQIRRRTFYKIGGVEGNEYPDRISKQYYALAKYRIWNLRLGCRGSSVPLEVQAKLKNSYPSAPPEVIPRCYFEESTVSRISLDGTQIPGESLVSNRKEVCTNYPLLSNVKEIRTGDIVDPGRQMDSNISHIPNLRRWNGGIFQMALKSEMHRNSVVKFTVVLMWNGSGWAVVDKF